jgi:hypothetical protein
LENRLVPTTITWTGANHTVDTNWSDALNWQGGVVPGSGDTANFTKTGTVSFTATIDTAFTVTGVTVDSTWNGTITADSGLTVTGNFAVSSGTFGGNGAVTIEGSASSWTAGTLIVGTGGFTNTGTFTVGGMTATGGGTLTNKSVFALSGNGSLTLESGTMLTNPVGSTLNFLGDADINQSTGGGTLTNAGKLEKTGGGDISTISTTFVNSGSIIVQVASLTLKPAGGISTGGIFTVSQSATLSLTGGGSFICKGTYTGTGLGTVALGGGTLQIASGGATFNMAGNLFQWTGGTIDVTNGNLTNKGTINYSGSNNVVILTGGGSLINSKSFIQTSNATLGLENTATFNNSKTGTYDFQADAGVNQSGGGTFVNAGTLKKSKGTGISTVSCPLNNTGTVSVLSGTLDISGTVTQVSGSTLTAGSWTVTHSASGATTLNLTSAGSLTTIGTKAKVTLSGLTTSFANINGAGGLNAILAGGSFTIMGGQSFTTAGNFSNVGSVILASGTLTITGSVAQLPSTTLTGGTWNVGASSNLNFPAGSNITALGAATVILTGSGSNFTALANLATVGSTGNFSLQGGRSFTTVGDFTNNGKLTLSPGSILTASGSFTQSSTATLTLQIGGTNSAPTFGQVVSTSGTVSLDGNLTVTSTVVPTVGSAFEIVDNEGNAAVAGALFSGLAEGSTFTVKKGSTTMTFQITYVGIDGDGSNNVIITRIS